MEHPEAGGSPGLSRKVCPSLAGIIADCNMSFILRRMEKCLACRPSAILSAMENRSFSDAGGTPGGLGHFALGFVMACIGGYLLVNQVTVVGSYWNFWGGNSFGITLLPMLFGIGLLFWRGRSIVGWILTIAGALFIFAGVLANMHIFFRPLSLFNTIVMLVLLVGGLGLIARGLQPHSKQSGD
jgi:hypothetical protein